MSENQTLAIYNTYEFAGKKYIVDEERAGDKLAVGDIVRMKGTGKVMKVPTLGTIAAIQGHCLILTKL